MDFPFGTDFMLAIDGDGDIVYYLDLPLTRERFDALSSSMQERFEDAFSPGLTLEKLFVSVPAEVNDLAHLYCYLELCL